MTSLSPLLAIAAGPDADPVTSLAKAWLGAEIKAEYFVYEEEQSDEELLFAFQARLLELCEEKECKPSEVVLGGFSRGARLAAILARQAGARGLLGLSYPFHKHGAPQERHGLLELQALGLPALIVQGTRDSHGNRQEVIGYGPMPSGIQVHWLEDGNHRWQPRQKTSTSSEDLLRSAAATTIDFLRGSLVSVRDD